MSVALFGKPRRLGRPVVQAGLSSPCPESVILGDLLNSAESDFLTTGAWGGPEGDEIATRNSGGAFDHTWPSESFSPGLGSETTEPTENGELVMTQPYTPDLDNAWWKVDFVNPISGFFHARYTVLAGDLGSESIFPTPLEICTAVSGSQRFTGRADPGDTVQLTAHIAEQGVAAGHADLKWSLTINWYDAAVAFLSNNTVDQLVVAGTNPYRSFALSSGAPANTVYFLCSVGISQLAEATTGDAFDVGRIQVNVS